MAVLEKVVVHKSVSEESASTDSSLPLHEDHQLGQTVQQLLALRTDCIHYLQISVGLLPQESVRFAADQAPTYVEAQQPQPQEAAAEAAAEAEAEVVAEVET